MILNDKQIIFLCKEKALMIPSLAKSEKLLGISGGPTPHGYDVRIGTKYQKPIGFKCVNPASSKGVTHHDYEGGVIPKEGLTINVGDVVQIETIEVFDMPPDITAVIFNKSTWQKLSLSMPNTIVDAGFKGSLTLCMKNNGPWPIVVHQGMGIAHLIFHQSEPADVPYEGKYQNQKEPTGAIFEEEKPPTKKEKK